MTPSTEKGKSVGSLAVRVIDVLLTSHPGNTVLDTCPHGCAVQACIRRYCPDARSKTHTSCSWCGDDVVLGMVYCLKTLVTLLQVKYFLNSFTSYEYYHCHVE